MYDYLTHLPRADHQAVKKLSMQHAATFNQDKKGFLRYRRPCARLAGFPAGFCDFSGDVVTIGRREELRDQDIAVVRESLMEFMPWRKGPFRVFGVDIDAEWRSERKWQRVIPKLPDLTGKIIADIGCSNGYYMFRMADQNPLMVLGFEPSLQPYFAFNALNSMAGQKNLHIEPFGVEDISLFPECFDVVFLMGIIYHRISPVEMLRDIKNSMKKGATLIVESQAIPGDQPVALFPEKRYAKVPGTYFVPTAKCLENWLKRVGFSGVEFFDWHQMSGEEQRKTEWMTFESYDDFINQDNKALTVEGYPAPIRVFLRATC